MKKSHPSVIFATVLAAMIPLLTACSGNEPAKAVTPTANPNAMISQENLCVVRSNNLEEAAKICKEGQKIAFSPDSWGNEQLPLNFIMGHCDLRYSVAMNNGGVVCIYKPIKTLNQVSITEIK